MTAAAACATITERAPAARVSLRLADPAAATGALGFALPERIGARAASGALSALRLGPDEWVVEAPEADALMAALRDLATRTPLSAVEVSDREITLALEGPTAPDLLATGCPRDLAKMPVGDGARTVFDTVQVVLTREAEHRFTLTIWRSFAPHVRSLLDRAARECAAGL